MDRQEIIVFIRVNKTNQVNNVERYVEINVLVILESEDTIIKNKGDLIEINFVMANLGIDWDIYMAIWVWSNIIDHYQMVKEVVEIIKLVMDWTIVVESDTERNVKDSLWVVHKLQHRNISVIYKVEVKHHEMLFIILVVNSIVNRINTTTKVEQHFTAIITN